MLVTLCTSSATKSAKKPENQQTKVKRLQHGIEIRQVFDEDDQLYKINIVVAISYQKFMVYFSVCFIIIRHVRMPHIILIWQNS